MDTKPGIFGAILTGLSGLIAWAMKHDAELRAAWLLLAILIAILTAIWWSWNIIARVYRAIKGKSDINPESQP